MLVRILDGVSAFFDYLTAVHPVPVLCAIAAQLAKLSCTSLAWRNVLVAAYPGTPIRRRSIVGAYLAGVGVNALVPLRAGDAVRIVLAHRAVERSTYTTVVSSTFVLSIFDITAASALLAWVALTQNALPGLGELPRLPSYDFSWLLAHPLAADLLVASFVLGLALLGFWIHGHVLDFWQRVKQAFTVVRSPARYLRTVALWQAGDWFLRHLAIWFMLGAFDIAQTVPNVLLVQAAASVATLLPLTPAGIGTEQAFLLYSFRGAVPSSQLLAFSVGMRIMLVATNIAAGFTAIALTLRTLRYKDALRPVVPEPPETPEQTRA